MTEVALSLRKHPCDKEDDDFPMHCLSCIEQLFIAFTRFRNAPFFWVASFGEIPTLI